MDDSLLEDDSLVGPGVTPAPSGANRGRTEPLLFQPQPRQRSRQPRYASQGADVELGDQEMNYMAPSSPTDELLEEAEYGAGVEQEEYEEGQEEDRSEEGGEGEGEDSEGSEEMGFGSETSSMMFDRDVDPVGWARRLDELAGVMEMGEREVRALKWGPDMRRQDVPLFPLDEFKDVLNHHLQTTEWKYAPSQDLFPSLPNRPSLDPAGMPGELGDVHPIRVLGRDWVGRGDDPAALSAIRALHLRSPTEDVDAGRDASGTTGLGISVPRV